MRELPAVKSIQGNFCLKIPAISYALGAMKFYPASLKFMGANRSKYEHMFESNSNDNGGSIEMTVGKTIQYHFPLEKRSEFNLTAHPKPLWKNQKKYTDLIKEGEKKKI